MNMTEYIAPKSILIIGSGVFGLSTALSLSLRPAFSATSITVIDKSPFPASDGSSIDHSRIIRADYKEPLYSELAASAQIFWRGHDRPTSPFGGELGKHGNYQESSLVLTFDGIAGSDGVEGSEYVNHSLENVKKIFGEKVQLLNDRDAIRAACKTGGVTGLSGYINHASGWADAEGGMRFLRQKVEARKNVTFLEGEVKELVYDDEGKRVTGARLKDGDVLEVHLTIMAAGAWTPGLVDLGGRAIATGQIMGYVRLTEEEELRYKRMPVIINFSNGFCVVPPQNGILKICRHAVGYVNHIDKIDPQSGKMVKVSAPKTSLSHPGLGIPPGGEAVLRRFWQEMFPDLGDRPFLKTRICWYTDTPTGDFIVTYHPDINGLFLATGGSGHGYKFLPVLGEEIVDILEGVPRAKFKELWRWREMVEGVLFTCEDGSRGGVVQQELDEALEEPNLKI